MDETIKNLIKNAKQAKFINTCPNSLRVLSSNDFWTLDSARKNQEICIEKLKELYISRTP